LFSEDYSASPTTDPYLLYKAVALSVRDKLLDSLYSTMEHFAAKKVRTVNYLSIEYLMGRALRNNLLNLGLEQKVREILRPYGLDLEAICDEENDAGLGNGGLGRLAACFLDSFATLNLPAFGYGLRYDYGIFKQTIEHAEQVEVPDDWLSRGNLWELERKDLQYEVKFYGRCVSDTVEGKQIRRWLETQGVVARAFDNPISGFNTTNTANLRLWKCYPLTEFSLKHFNQGDYTNATRAKNEADLISSVLYPNDNTDQGKELRLKQQYFFVSASMQDIMRRFSESFGTNWTEFPDFVAIQLNDTHPTLAIVELLRILMDKFYFTLPQAHKLAIKVFNYTNHTLMQEALERWSVELLGKLLPRHMEIIYDLNHLFLQEVSQIYPGDVHKMQVLSLIEESCPKKVRMANLCVISTSHVNGVSNLHYHLIKDELFKDFSLLYPKKFLGITNGVTLRRWVHQANPGLSEIYSKLLESQDWLTNGELLKTLETRVSDSNFCQNFCQVKFENKKRLAAFLKQKTGIDVDSTSCFDIMIKRFHEYKRQLMAAFYIVHRWLKLRGTSLQEKEKSTRRTFIFGGKAAPGYLIAKLVIKFINRLAEVINDDPATSKYLKVVFLPNYNVSAAELLTTGADFNHQISCAGTEASGTSNMKFVLNGSVIIGTHDGANIEIGEQVGGDNLIEFGLQTQDVLARREELKNSEDIFATFPNSLKAVIDEIHKGTFGDSRSEWGMLLDSIKYSKDHYLIGTDFDSYIAAMDKADQIYKDQDKYTKMAILNSLRSGAFSSDRCIREYAEKIWKVHSVKVS